MSTNVDSLSRRTMAVCFGMFIEYLFGINLSGRVAQGFLSTPHPQNLSHSFLLLICKAVVILKAGGQDVRDSF
jgi:hypothetical protein